MVESDARESVEVDAVTAPNMNYSLAASVGPPGLRALTRQVASRPLWDVSFCGNVYESAVTASDFTSDPSSPSSLLG